MKNKKYYIFLSLSWVFIVLFVASLFLVTKDNSSTVLWIIIMIVSVVASIIFSFLAKKEQEKSQSGASANNFQSDNIENLKQNLVDYAFDKLLKEGEDYTIIGRVQNAVLVKKIPKWIYCEYDQYGKLQALFTITTDKGEYGFQAQGDSLIRVPAELINGIYDKGESDDNDEPEALEEKPNQNLAFNNWLDAELKNIKKIAVAFNFNIYENEDNFSVELIAADSFDEEDEDWACDELYSSREDGQEYEFSAKDDEEAFSIIETCVTNYLEQSANAKTLKDTKAVAVGFVDGDLKIVYKRQ